MSRCPSTPRRSRREFPFPTRAESICGGNSVHRRVTGFLRGRALSLFIVNERSAGERERQDEQFLFQVRLELFFEAGFVPRPNRQGEKAKEWGDRGGGLQFPDHLQFAVGHGVSVEVSEPGDPARRVRTTWLPRSEVRLVMTREEKAVVTDMESL